MCVIMFALSTSIHPSKGVATCSNAGCALKRARSMCGWPDICIWMDVNQVVPGTCPPLFQGLGTWAESQENIPNTYLNMPF